MPITLQARQGEMQLQGHLTRDKMPRQAFHIARKGHIDLRQRMMFKYRYMSPSMDF